MKIIRDFFGGRDLLHLALVLSLLRVDPPLLSQHHIRLENDHQIRNRVNPISQKVIDDLGDLGRFSSYDSLNYPLFDRLDVAAYMLNSLTRSPNQYEDSHQGYLHEDIDSGVSELGQLSDAETDGYPSPSNSGFEGLVDLGSPYGADFNGISESEAANFSDEITFPYLESPLVDHFDGVDWNEIETFANSRPFDDGVGLSDEGVSSNVQNPIFSFDSDCLMELDFLGSVDQPDEKDVENQIIEIDNHLISLNGSIQSLSDGVRHLGEQLATAQTESDVGSFLLESFDTEETLNDPVLEASFPEFNDWELSMDVNQTANEIFQNPNDFLSKLYVLGKENLLEDFDETVLSEKVSTTPSNGEKKEDVSGKSHLEDHTYAAAQFYEDSKYGSSFETFGAAAMPSESLDAAASSEFHRSRETRDEIKARKLGIPFSLSEIIDSSMEEYSQLIAQAGLTEEQLALCRDIRRRGKNKVAAQNCRRRKLDLISSLEDEVSQAQTHKQQLLAEREELFRLRSEWSDKLRFLEEAVLRGLNKNVEEYSLQTVEDGRGEIRLVQRNSSRVAKSSRA